MSRRLAGVLSCLGFTLLLLIFCSTVDPEAKIEAENSLRFESLFRSVVSLHVAPKYKAVQFLTTKTMSSRPEVKNVNLTYGDMYSHVYQAFSFAEKNDLSLAAFGRGNAKVVGVSLTLRYPQLAEMFAPGVLTDVLDFVRPCYASEMKKDVERVWIRILEGSASEKVHRELLKVTTWRYISLPSSEQNGLLLWSSNKKDGRFLKRLGFRLRTCGENNYHCDWTRLGFPTEVARDICLFHI